MPSPAPRRRTRRCWCSAAPARGIHAGQVEIDRARYLDSRLDGLGPGFDRTVALLRSLLAAVADEALAGAPPFALAAE